MHTLILNADATPLSQLPLSAVSWKKAIQMYFLGKINIIKSYDDWTIRSQRLEMNVPSIAMMTEQVNTKRSVKYSRTNVYLRDEFICQLQITSYCSSIRGRVEYNQLTLDHVVPRSSGGRTSWTNVCTSCKACNSMKGDDPYVYPIRPPHRPTYYEILYRRKQVPLVIKDESWAEYLDWPQELIVYSKNIEHLSKK